MEIIKPAWHWRVDPSVDPLYLPNVDSIALHHMASATGTIWDVEQWHLDRPDNWKGFGYNWWVGFDGKVYEGRGFNSGAGVSNQNGHIISVGFQGNYYPSDKIEVNTVMPDAQFNSGVEIIAWIKSQLPRTDIIVDGHKRWEATGCPGDYFPLQAMINGTATNVSSELKIGSKGTAVTDLQLKLNKVGYKLVTDGDFGTLTDTAVRSFQSGNGLVSDGIVGPITMTAIDSMVKKLESQSAYDPEIIITKLREELAIVKDSLVASQNESANWKNKFTQFKNDIQSSLNKSE